MGMKSIHKPYAAGLTRNRTIRLTDVCELM